MSTAPSASLMSSLKKYYFVLFSWILPMWLTLQPQNIELKTSLCPCPFWFWYPTLYAVNPKLAWHRRLTMHTVLALCAHVPNPRCAQKQRALAAFCCSFQQEHMCCSRKEEWKCYSENGSRSLWMLKEISWVSSWKSVVSELGSQEEEEETQGKTLRLPAQSPWWRCFSRTSSLTWEATEFPFRTGGKCIGGSSSAWGLVARGCFPDWLLDLKMRPAWLVETVSYRWSSRKVRAWVTGSWMAKRSARKIVELQQRTQNDV